jgi:hypothetical protein
MAIRANLRRCQWGDAQFCGARAWALKCRLGLVPDDQKGRVSFVGARVNTRAKVASRPVRSPGGRWQSSGDRHHHEGKAVAIA